MKTNVITIFALFMLLSCGGNPEAKLASLKKQHDQIAIKIAELEKEIAAKADSASLDAAGTFVSVEPVQYKPFNHYIEVQGKLDGDDNLAVYPETMGNVVEINVKVGQHVVAGQILARINDGPYQEQLKSLQSTYQLAQETFQKLENLWKQQIGSEIQFLQAKTNKESLESQIASLKKQIEMTHIESPINGNVEESLIKVGQAVSPSFPAFRVVNFSNLKVSADVAEAYTAKINKGDEVIVYLPDINQEIKARVSFCSKYINPTNRTFSVEAMFTSDGDKFKANMVAVLKINDYRAEKAVVLPINIVQSDNQGKYVLVASRENNQYTARKKVVETGQVYNGLTEITRGLEPGQQVITSGYLSLNEGEIIRF